jgi:hypothetical protein
LWIFGQDFGGKNTQSVNSGDTAMCEGVNFETPLDLAKIAH